MCCLVFDPAALPTVANRVVVAGFPGLPPRRGCSRLYSPFGRVIDALNWGTPDRAWPDYRAGLWTPGLDPLTRPTTSWGRTWPPGAPPTRMAPTQDWTIHETLSPGGSVGPPPGYNGPYLGDLTRLDRPGLRHLLVAGLYHRGHHRLALPALAGDAHLLAVAHPGPVGHPVLYVYVVAIGFASPAAR